MSRVRQLRMRRPSLDDLPAVEVPAGYGLRTFRPGDARHWAAIMESPAGIGSDWTVEKVRATLIERAQFAADGLFFATTAATAPATSTAPAAATGITAATAATSDAGALAGSASEGDVPVATATAWRVPPEERATGYVHMVCALPEHRGRGLGRLVTLAVLHYLREHDFRDAVLETDDFRLPAIRSYLGLGFVPVYLEDAASDHAARWSAVFARLWGRGGRG